MEDYNEQYEQFFKSNFGKHVIKTLEDMADSLVRQAASQPTADLAYGFTKEASGVIKAVDHFRTGAAMK